MMAGIDIEALKVKFGVPDEFAADFEGVVNAMLLSITRHKDDCMPQVTRVYCNQPVPQIG